MAALSNWTHQRLGRLRTVAGSSNRTNLDPGPDASIENIRDRGVHFRPFDRRRVLPTGDRELQGTSGDGNVARRVQLRIRSGTAGCYGVRTFGKTSWKLIRGEVECLLMGKAPTPLSEIPGTSCLDGLWRGRISTGSKCRLTS